MLHDTAKRWIKICLRTLHLLFVAGVGGGILLGIDPSAWLAYWWLALVSGGLMILVDVLSNPLWIIQVRGLVMYLKIILLILMGVYPSMDRPVLVAIIVISAVISHAPGKLRYYSVYHRKVLSSQYDTKG